MSQTVSASGMRSRSASVRGRPSSRVKANRPPVVSAPDISRTNASLSAEGEHGLQQEHDVERPGRDRGNARDLEATRQVTGALTRDRDGAGAQVHAQIGTAELPGDESSRPGDSTAEVEHGDPWCDAGLHGQGADLPGEHEALLLDVFAGGVRRHAGPLESLDEWGALVLPHGCSMGVELSRFGLGSPPAPEIRTRVSPVVPEVPENAEERREWLRPPR